MNSVIKDCDELFRYRYSTRDEKTLWDLHHGYQEVYGNSAIVGINYCISPQYLLE